MNGDKLFTMQEGTLTFKLAPAIPAYLVKDDGKVEATLFGKIRVVYDCGSKRDLIPGQYVVTKYELVAADGNAEICEGAVVSGEAAQRVRDGKVAEIRVTIR